MRLIESESVGLAVSYGWRELPRFLKTCWWITILAAGAMALSGYSPYPDLVGDVSLFALLIPPIFYAASRATGERIRFTGKSVIMSLLFAAQFEASDLIKALVPRLGVWVFALLIAIIPIIWLSVRLGASLSFFVLQKQRVSILDAYLASWNFVRGDTWWRFVGVNFLTTLAVLVASIAYNVMLLQPDFLLPDHVIISLSFGMAFILAVSLAWWSISSVALASTAPALAEPAEA